MSKTAGGLEKSDTLRLAMVLDSAEHVERVSNHFRNGGIAVRAVAPQSFQQFHDLLRHPFDMVFCDTHNQDLSITRMAALLQQQHKDIPIVALLKEFNEQTALTALQQGATLAVPYNNLLFVERSVRQEWRNLKSRQASSVLQEQIEESNKRCDSLIDSSRDAIAYIHQGMHIRANNAYLQLFGLLDFDEVEGMSLLDLVAGEDVPMFKTVLKQQDAQTKTQKITLKVKASDNPSLPVDMEISPAWYEGEACWQVLVRVRNDDPRPNDGRTDPTTGTLARGAFLDEARRLADHTGLDPQGIGLLVCGPENFTEVSNNIPLSSVDQILAGFAQHLLHNAPSNSSVGRLGESMFGVVFPLNNINAEQVAHQLVQNFRAFVLSTDDYSIAMPIKLAALSWTRPQSTTIDTVVTEVMKAFEHSKASVHIMDFTQAVAHNHENIDVSRVAAALEHKRVHVEYTPINALHGSTFDFYLANVVLYDDQRRIIEVPTHMPMDLAQQWQQTRWLCALSSLSQQSITPNTKILLPISLSDETNWLENVPQQLSGAQLPSQLFVLELNEADVLVKLKIAQDTVRSLKSLGMEIGLGGFGNSDQTGTILQHLNPQWVRFGAELTNGLSSSPEQQSRLSTMAGLAQEQGKKVIASEIQDAMSMSILFAANVEYAQGDFLAPAINALPVR